MGALNENAVKGDRMSEQSQNGEVIALSLRESTLFDTEIAPLTRYWEEMCPPGNVPRRMDVDPRRIEPLLEHALIAERVAPGLARLRIAGAHLSDLMGMEVRGMPLSAFIVPAQRDALADLLSDLFERPARLDLGLQVSVARGGAALSGRLVLLPLRSDLGDISRALGCLVTQGAIGAGPHRFEITSHRVTPISLRAGDATEIRHLAEAPAPFTGAKQRPPRKPQIHPSERPYLRLVT